MVSCNKKMDSFNSITNNEGAVIPTNEFVKYTINKGEQFCDKNYFTKVSYETLNFSVKFDSSAIYRTARLQVTRMILINYLALVIIIRNTTSSAQDLVGGGTIRYCN
jgi:hypothetical protein